MEKDRKKKQIDFFFQVFTFLEGRYWFHEPFEVWSFDTTVTIPKYRMLKHDSIQSRQRWIFV